MLLMRNPGIRRTSKRKITHALVRDPIGKATWRTLEGCIQLILQVTVHHWGRSGHGLKEAEVMEGCSYKLAPHGLLSLFLLQVKVICPGLSSPMMDWAFPHQSLVKKMCPTGQYGGSILSIEFSSSQRTPGQVEKQQTNEQNPRQYNTLNHKESK